MKKLILAVIMLMVATAAWGDDTRPYTNCHGLWLPVDECENSQLEAGWYSPKTVQPYDDHSVTPSSYYDVGSDDIIPLLEQCLEYIPDGDRNYLETEITATTLLYIPPYRTLKDDAEDEAQKAQKKLDRLKAQTDLNHKIKEILKRMKGE